MAQVEAHLLEDTACLLALHETGYFARAASGLRLPRRFSADVWFSATRIFCVRRSTVSSRWVAP